MAREVVPTTPPNFSSNNLLALCNKLDPERNKADPAYEFSNGRKFESSDRSTTGVYESN